MMLPTAFLQEMQTLLGDAYAAFLDCMQSTPLQGIRLNPLKCTPEILQRAFATPLQPSVFSGLSYTLPQTEKIGANPLHHAGGFYSQEPSAASAVTVLDPQPGEKILDLCAAPGGKSTQIASLLDGKGLLWSNEIVKNRAMVLLSNIERLGIRNAVVSSCFPEKLCTALQGYFDKVLVDAPCSGEGMFRKDETAITEWSEAHSEACAQRQVAILRSAAAAVKAGGVLVYSTCTFSYRENEGVIHAFLAQEPGFTVEEPGVAFGRPGVDLPAVRIYPMDGGEGHFVCKLRKNREEPCFALPFAGGKNKEGEALGTALFAELFAVPLKQRLYVQKEKLLLLPDILPETNGLGVLRAGVELGTVKGKRAEPSHHAFMCARPEECRHICSFSVGDAALAAYYRGEEIDCAEKGYTAVAVEGVVTGFGKASGGMLKNHYPKGLRTHG